jgi:hypothetical protein
VLLTKFDAQKAGYGQSYGYGYGYGDTSFGQKRLAFGAEGSRRQIKDFAGENSTRRDDFLDR